MKTMLIQITSCTGHWSQSQALLFIISFQKPYRTPSFLVILHSHNSSHLAACESQPAPHVSAAASCGWLPPTSHCLSPYQRSSLLFLPSFRRIGPFHPHLRLEKQRAHACPPKAQYLRPNISWRIKNPSGCWCNPTSSAAAGDGSPSDPQAHLFLSLFLPPSLFPITHPLLTPLHHEVMLHPSGSASPLPTHPLT